MNDSLRVLIVDDEPIARELIRLLLAGDPEIAITGECTGVDAAAAVRRDRPDILFLDVRMPGVDGFALLGELGPSPSPVVIFVTAHAEYAVRAFDFRVFDYVLKPIDDERFAEAVHRAKEEVRLRRLSEPGGGAGPPGATERRPRRFLLPARNRTLVLNDDEIEWIEAADYYASIHVGGASHLLRETLTELEKRLDPELFFRVHRSAIVNIGRVREIHPLFRGDALLVLRDGSRVRLSRTRRREFDRLFSRPGRRP